MKTSVKLMFLGVLGSIMAPVASQAQWWSQHPAYLHVLSDLRTAHWLIQHRGASDPVQGAEESNALAEIDAAYHDLEAASVSDGKNLADQPPANFPWDNQRGRLHQAVDVLHKAHEELRGAEDNPAARDLRARAIRHVEAASALTRSAIQHYNY